MAVVQRVLGVMLMALSLSMLPPFGVSLWYQDGETRHFLWSLGVMFGAGLLIWFPVRGRRHELRTRDGFIIVTLFWVALGSLSALPFMFGPHLSFTDSLFESISAFTTTGATVIVGLDQLPRSILYYRQQLQWLGGMGIVVLAVAVLPMLGIGGMQLYRAETPGPIKDDKLTPRIQQTAQTLWYLYIGLTVACALGYWLGGMSLFDAIGHSFATVSTGGFSTHDASMAYFHSLPIEVVANVFMLAGGINFAIHYLAWRSRNPWHYLRDLEVRTFLLVVAAVTLVCTAVLLLTGHHPSAAVALRESAFQVISIITSTGFTTADFGSWPLLLPALLIFSSFIGGCGGSTAGGMKVMRFILLYQQLVREVKQLLHARAVVPVKVQGRVVPTRVAQAVWGFFAIYIAMFCLMLLAVMATGLDQVTAFAAVATCMNNMGPGLGELSSNFTAASPVAKWIFTAAMLLGRLEVYTVLVILTPEFWRD